MSNTVSTKLGWEENGNIIPKKSAKNRKNSAYLRVIKAVVQGFESFAPFPPRQLVLIGLPEIAGRQLHQPLGIDGTHLPQVRDIWKKRSGGRFAAIH